MRTRIEEVNKEFAESVERLTKPGETIRDSITAQRANLIHLTLGVAGESGELVDAVKKHVIYNKDLDVTNLVEEMGDLLFYIQGIALQLGIDFTEIMEYNIDKLKQRYPTNYTDEAAQQRRDKQEG